MQIPWAMRFLLKVPFGASAVTKFRSFAVTSAKKRLKKGAATKDLFYYLVCCSVTIHRNPSEILS